MTAPIFKAPHLTFHHRPTPSIPAPECLSVFTYTLLSVRDMASSVSASLDTSLSLVLLTGAKEPTWQELKESPLLYDLWRWQQQSSGWCWCVANRWVTPPFIFSEEHIGRILIAEVSE